MKWFHNRCPRRELSLLAAGALPEEARPEIERHLATCSRCQAHFNELKALAEPLANWEKDFAHIEPTPAMQKRWAEAVQAATAETTRLAPSPARRKAPVGRVPPRGVLGDLRWAAWLQTAWLELIWPCRRSWTGLAAVWLALLAVNARLPARPAPMAGGSPSVAAPMGLWEEQLTVLAGMAQPAVDVPAPVKPQPTPALPPRPRSSRKPDWQLS